MGLGYIEAQLEDGYIDLGLSDEEELEIVREAIELYKKDKDIDYVMKGEKDEIS